MLNSKRADELMRTEGVDALLASSVNNVYYFTGFWSFAGDYSGNEIGKEEASYALKPLDGEKRLVLPAFDEGFLPETKLLCTFYGKSAGLAGEKIFTDMGAIRAVANTVREIGVDKGTIAVDTAFPLVVARALETELPEVSLKSDSTIFNGLRMIKSPEEISRMRKSAEILEYGYQMVLDHATVGMTELEMVNLFRYSIVEKYKSIARDIEFGHLEVGNGVRGGKGAGTSPTNYAAKLGDVIHFDPGVRYKRYIADSCRDAVLGKETSEIRETHRILREVQKITIDALGPGTMSDDVFKVALSEIRKLGLETYDTAYFGHGIGLGFHEWPFIDAVTKVPLQENMVINIEIPHYNPRLGGFNLEETCLITATGAETLTNLPRDLFVS